MSNTNITYLVGGGLRPDRADRVRHAGLAPALQSHRRVWERVAVIVLSGYVLAAFVGVGVVLGAWIVLQWPNWF